MDERYRENAAPVQLAAYKITFSITLIALVTLCQGRLFGSKEQTFWRTPPPLPYGPGDDRGTAHFSCFRHQDTPRCPLNRAILFWYTGFVSTSIGKGVVKA